MEKEPAERTVFTPRPPALPQRRDANQEHDHAEKDGADRVGAPLVLRQGGGVEQFGVGWRKGA